MILTDAETVHLKSWLVSKLETISEADSQILSDYVVALLQAETSEAELQANAVENLTDFLGDNTKKFVQEVFGVIRSKKYIPGKTSSPLGRDQQDEHRDHRSTGHDANNHEETVTNRSENRKRHYDELRRRYVDWDAPDTIAEPSRKRFRRSSEFRRAGSRGGGRFGEFHQREPRIHGRETRLSSFKAKARDTLQNNVRADTRYGGTSGMRQDLILSNGMDDFVQTPQDSGFRAEMPFDPNVALQAILTLQAMGFPMPFPGDLSAAGTPPTLSASSQGALKYQTICRDYESKGICLKGSACRFQHQGHEIQGHSQDRSNATDSSAQSWDGEAAQKKYEARKALLEQTELKRRELVAKQQEIELLKAVELQKMKDALIKKGKELPPDLEETSDAAIAGSEKTKQLLAQLKALEDEAKSLGLDEEPWFNGERGYHYNGSHRGRGSYHRGWRGYPRRGGGYMRGIIPGNGAYNLDNRPKQVRVDDVDFDTAKEESLKQFLPTIGDFESIDPDIDRKSYIVTFKDRRTAEAFYYGSTDIPAVGKVKLSWVTKPSVSSGSPRKENAEVLGQESISADERTNSNSKDEALDHTVQREDDIDYGNEDYEWIV